MANTVDFYLYHTLGCHLCEDAEAIVLAASAGNTCQYQKVDIADDDGLVERYGVHIPVFYRLVDGKELFWPFDEVQVAEFLKLSES